MFDYWRRKRQLNREINKLIRANRRLWIEGTDGGFAKHSTQLAEYKITRSGLEAKLKTLETVRLLDIARRYPIELPAEQAFVAFDSDSFKSLKPAEMATLQKNIRDYRRSNLEWWINLIATLITPLTGLLGVIIGLIALLKA
jgi:hypothetical protein